MTKNGFACFLMGVGAGVGLALLFVPESGEQIRQRIKAKKDEGLESLKKGGDALKEKAADLVGKGKEAVGRAKDAVAETAEAGRQAVDEAPGV
jgi:gas vesicle protein